MPGKCGPLNNTEFSMPRTVLHQAGDSRRLFVWPNSVAQEKSRHLPRAGRIIAMGRSTTVMGHGVHTRTAFQAVWHASKAGVCWLDNGTHLSPLVNTLDQSSCHDFGRAPSVRVLATSAGFDRIGARRPAERMCQQDRSERASTCILPAPRPPETGRRNLERAGLLARISPSESHTRCAGSARPCTAPPFSRSTA